MDAGRTLRSAVRLCSNSDARARSVARRLARAVGLVPIKLPGSLSRDQRVAYHTAASLVSNDCLALLDTGVELFGALGLEPRAAIAALFIRPPKKASNLR